MESVVNLFLFGGMPNVTRAEKLLVVTKKLCNHWTRPCTQISVYEKGLSCSVFVVECHSNKIVSKYDFVKVCELITKQNNRNKAQSKTQILKDL